MAYLVNVTSRAERDFACLYDDINAQHSYAALKWYRGLSPDFSSQLPKCRGARLCREFTVVEAQK